MTMGIDIDIRVIKHGKSARKSGSKFGVKASDGSSVDVWTNFAQYGLQPPVALFVGDLHALPTRRFGLEGTLQGIVADPPYGVRAGGRKSGGRKPLPEDYAIPEEMRETHIPSTAPYPFAEMNDDLMELAARFLSIGGRLTFFLPGSTEDAEREIRDLPAHPALRLRWHSLETFNQIWGRRLVTYEKIHPYDVEVARKAREDAVAARAASDEPDLIERMRALVYDQVPAEAKRRKRYEKFHGVPPPDALTERARIGISEAARSTGARACVTGGGSILRVHMKEQPPRNFREAFLTPDENVRLKTMLDHLFDAGFVMINTCTAMMSTPMTEVEIDALIGGCEDGFKKIASMP